MAAKKKKSASERLAMAKKTKAEYDSRPSDRERKFTKAAHDSRPSDRERKLIKDAMKKKKAPKSKMSAHMRDMMADKAYGSGDDTGVAMGKLKKGIKKAKKRKVQKDVDRIVSGAKKTIKSRFRRP